MQQNKTKNKKNQTTTSKMLNNFFSQKKIFFQKVEERGEDFPSQQKNDQIYKI